MDDLREKIIKKAIVDGILSVPDPRMPEAHINSAELYLTFKCNDSCSHCITESGPKRPESMTPENAFKAIDNIARHSIHKILPKIYGNGTFRHEGSNQCHELDSLLSPPEQLTYALLQKYNVCATHRDCESTWVTSEGTFKLNLRKPSIRLSGGEFFCWPLGKDGKTLSEKERLGHQKDLIRHIRKTLPEYDLWILTNGRFASSAEKAETVIGSWAETANNTEYDSNVRICLSVDIFHSPPPESTIEQMLERVWTNSIDKGLPAPHIYGIPNQSIGLVGNALRNFKKGRYSKAEVENRSCSSFNPFTYLNVDPFDLVESNGCGETKGFMIEHGEGVHLVHNVFISPQGRMVFCCACVGDYGDFINAPGDCMKNIVTNPLALAMRRKETVIPLLNLVADMDSTIRIFGEGEFANVTGSTCYQFLSGHRP
ncbi:MAG: hypothetical protein KOO63_00955 [Bacteroidales bacterium]|nr:hypothetical protein [Candidatus Latescibacterota bacterium]